MKFFESVVVIVVKVVFRFYLGIRVNFNSNFDRIIKRGKNRFNLFCYFCSYYFFVVIGKNYKMVIEVCVVRW